MLDLAAPGSRSLAGPGQPCHVEDDQRDELRGAAGGGGHGVGWTARPGIEKTQLFDLMRRSARECRAARVRPPHGVRHPRHSDRPQPGAAADRPAGAERRRGSRQGSRDLPRRGPPADRTRTPARLTDGAAARRRGSGRRLPLLGSRETGSDGDRAPDCRRIRGRVGQRHAKRLRARPGPAPAT